MKQNWVKRLCVFFLATGLAGAAGAQGVTLEQAIAEARAGSFPVRAATSATEGAQSVVTAARAEYLPTLSANANFSRYDGDVFYERFIGGQPGQSQDSGGTPVEPFDATGAVFLQLGQVLYAGGAREAQVSARRIQVEMAGAELVVQQRKLDFDVSRAFYDVLLALRSVEVAETSIERSKQTLDEVQRRLNEDEALRVELLGAESRLASDEHELIKAENQLALARRAFNHHLARDQNADVELSGELSRSSFRADRATAAQEALNSSPEIQKAELAVGLTDTMLRGAKSNFKPKLEFEGSFSWLDNETFFKGTYYSASLNISIPFFQDARAGRGAAGEARARKALEESSLAHARSGIEIEVERSLNAVEEAEAAVALATKSLEYYRERYRVAQVSYREQVATFSDLLDDQAGLQQAELQVAGAHHQARVAEARVRQLTGK